MLPTQQTQQTQSPVVLGENSGIISNNSNSSRPYNNRPYWTDGIDRPGLGLGLGLGLYIGLLPVSATMKYPRSPLEWGNYIRNKVMNTSNINRNINRNNSTGGDVNAGNRVVENNLNETWCAWNMDPNDMLNVELLHHVQRIQKSIRATSTSNSKAGGPSNVGPAAETDFIFSLSDLEYFKKNMKLWSADQIKSLHTNTNTNNKHPITPLTPSATPTVTVTAIPWELFLVWFEWFHPIITYIIVVSMCVDVDHKVGANPIPLVTYSNHSNMTKKLSQDLQPVCQIVSDIGVDCIHIYIYIYMVYFHVVCDLHFHICFVVLYLYLYLYLYIYVGFIYIMLFGI